MDYNKEECLIEENQQRRLRVNYLSDEEEDVSKRLKGFGYHSPTKESNVQHLSSEESLQNTEHEAETAKGSVDLPSDVGPSALTEQKTFEYADLDFSNFDKKKDESCFKVGQVWDAYDTLDVRVCQDKIPEDYIESGHGTQGIIDNPYFPNLKTRLVVVLVKIAKIWLCIFK
uniref:DnaJ protein n=1 Tax=Solanum tuberosum TaxID=4113 RepID=M1DAN6_SOLTU